MNYYLLALFLVSGIFLLVGSSFVGFFIYDLTPNELLFGEFCEYGTQINFTSDTMRCLTEQENLELFDFSDLEYIFCEVHDGTSDECIPIQRTFTDVEMKDD